MKEYLWVLILGATCCFAIAFMLGAVSMSIFWGPVVGAKVMSHRTAVLLQVGCQILGNVVLGPHYLPPYAGVLKQGTTVAESPVLVLYALLCVSFVLLICHLLAYWQHVPLPPYTVLVISLAGSALIFPGGNTIDWGTPSQKAPPFVSGLGPLWIAYAVMPLITFACVAFLMLCFRRFMRAEDSFHEIVWILPAVACASTMLSTSVILYSLASRQGVRINTLSPQAVVIVLCAAGSAMCVYTCLVAPASIRKLGYAIRPEVQIRRMNLLGLPDDVVQEIAASRTSASDAGWLRHFWDHTLQKDMFVVVNKSDKLIQIHATAEQFDPTTENLFRQMSMWYGILMSTAFSASMFRSGVGIFAVMLEIYTTAEVSATFPVPVSLRCAAAVCTSLGAVFGGGRLMPVIGVQLSKLTPFRTSIVLVGTAVASVLARALNADVLHTYVSVTAIVAVGAMEGVSHVNWKQYFKLLTWWYLGCIPIFLVTALLFWQGTRTPSIYTAVQTKADRAIIKASNAALTDTFGTSLLAATSEIADDPLAELEALHIGIQRLVEAYTSVTLRCTNSTGG